MILVQLITKLHINLCPIGTPLCRKERLLSPHPHRSRRAQLGHLVPQVICQAMSLPASPEKFFVCLSLSAFIALMLFSLAVNGLYVPPTIFWPNVFLPALGSLLVEFITLYPSFKRIKLSFIVMKTPSEPCKQFSRTRLPGENFQSRSIGIERVINPRFG